MAQKGVMMQFRKLRQHVKQTGVVVHRHQTTFQGKRTRALIPWGTAAPDKHETNTDESEA
jgi:hypothetical protein